MPDEAVAGALHLVADLHMELVSEHGNATAHLSGDTDGLVLDVDQPLVLARAFGRRQVQLPPEAADLVRDLPVVVTSEGQDIGRITVTPDGAVRIRPTVAGVVSTARAVAAELPWRTLAIGAASALAAVLVVVRLRRRP